ncbi:hypothetical protein ACI65C_006234 [Semiaphis heraclei]
MKIAWRKILSDWKSSTEGLKNTVLQKQSFPALLKQLLSVLQLPMATTLQNGFRKCGIYPCDLNELLERLPDSKFNNSSVEETFIQHLSSKRSETAQPLRNKRKKLHVAPGKSYAHDDNKNSSVEGPRSLNLWQDHAKHVQQSTSRKSHRGRLQEESGFPSELNLYLKSSHTRLSDDPLLIWKDMCNVYPILSKVAVKYLVPVATSVPSERLFSKAGTDE